MRRRAAVAAAAAGLVDEEGFAGDLFEVVRVAFGGRVVVMVVVMVMVHAAMFFSAGHAQMVAASATIVLKLLILKVFERFGLLKLLDELHVVLEGIHFARVAALGDARILRRYVIRGAVLRRFVASPGATFVRGQFATLCGHN